MKIKNLNLTGGDTEMCVVDGMGEPSAPNGPSAANGVDKTVVAASEPHDGTEASVNERQSLEIAILKVRIQHLELVIEAARGLMGSNQERLLRRLHEVPRELATLSAQLRRIDPHFVW